MASKHPTRREVIARGLAASAAAPMFIPGSALGADGRPAPSNRVVMAAVGIGWQGSTNLKRLMKHPDCQYVAVCDVDGKHREAAANTVNKHYKNKDCKTYSDFREVMARKDIDAISQSTPDHWHALVSIAAAESGKDVFGEKPLTHTHDEGVALTAAFAKHKRIWQTGSWQRSLWNFRIGCQLALTAIGKVHRVEIGLPSGHRDFAKTGKRKSPEPVPEYLDYDFWCGPSRKLPYIPARLHKNWRWALDYGGGQLMDWIGHHNDIAHWGTGKDLDSPVEVSGKGTFPPRDAVWNSATKFRIETKYADGLVTVIAGGHKGIAGGTKFYGEDGKWVHVNRGRFKTNPNELRIEATEADKKRPDNSGELRFTDESQRSADFKLFKSPGHWRNFLDCVKSRQTTLTPSEVAHRSAVPGHLGHVSMLLDGRKLTYDPKAQKIVGDDEAQKLLAFNPRKPWKLS